MINYQPNDDDPLAKLINDKIPLDVVPSIINPKYSKPVTSHDTEEKTSEEIVPALPSDTQIDQVKPISPFFFSAIIE